MKRISTSVKSAALVTGAARRIGRACAIELARQGMGVVLHYNSSRKQAESLAATLRSKGATVWTVQGDLANPATAAALFEQSDKLSGGRIELLVNSASIYESGRPADTTLASLQNHLNINALSPFLLAQAFARVKSKGSIINLLDTRVVTQNNGFAAYHLSKTLLTAMTRMLALEYAPGIRVNGIAPGVILPPPGKPLSYAAKAAQANPMKRIGGPKDIVSAMNYLIEAEFVTGQILYVDGGYHLKGGPHE